MLDHLEVNGANLIYPDSLSYERVQYLEQRGISEDIAAVDLEMVKMKIADCDEGLGWERDKIDAVEELYKKFLHLCKKYGKGIVPTKEIDQFWHYHILDTRAYHSFCNDVFGGYFHHYPYFGMRGEEDAQNLETAFFKTKDLFLKEFNEPMVSADVTDCWHDCVGRCWHACSSVSLTTG